MFLVAQEIGDGGVWGECDGVAGIGGLLTQRVEQVAIGPVGPGLQREGNGIGGLVADEVDVLVGIAPMGVVETDG